MDPCTTRQCCSAQSTCRASRLSSEFLSLSVSRPLPISLHACLWLWDILGLLSTVQRRPTSHLGEEWAAAGWLTSTRLTSLPFPADEAEFSGRYDVNSSLVGRSSLSRVSVGSSSPGPANDPAQPAHAVFGAARPRHVTVRVVLAVTSAQTFVLRIMPHGQSGRVKTEAESCVRFGYA